MPRPKLPPGPGRPKGSQNRITRELKDMILEALSDAGGIGYLKGQAEKNPAAFLTLVGKVLPMTVNASHSGPDGKPLVTRVIHVYTEDVPQSDDHRG